jgi:WD40 repeat protein
MTAGLGLVPRGARASQPPQRPDPAPAAVPSDRPQPGPIARADDPLPKSARARLGTSRFHCGNAIGQVLYTPDGKSLVTCDADRVVRVWDAATGQIVRNIGDTQAEFREIALSPDGQTLATVEQPGQTPATAERPGRLCLWELATGRQRRRWHDVRGEDYEHLSFSPDGRTVAAGVTRHDPITQRSATFIGLWDSDASTERRRRIPGEWARLWDLEFSPDGKLLATASRDSEIMRGNVLIGPGKVSARLWEIATGRELRRFPVQGLDVGSLAFAPDGKRLAAVIDGTIRFCDLTTGQEHTPRLAPELVRPPGGEVKAVPIRPGAIGCLAFAPDGSILAAGESRVNLGDFSLATVSLWDVARGRELHRIPAHRQWVASLSFSPDGKTLASTGAEPVIRLWDVATGRGVFPQSGHRSAVRSLAVSPADGTVFTGGDDGTIRHWDPVSGRESGLIVPISGPVEALAVAPDGKILLVRGPIEPQPQQAGWIVLWSVAEHREIRRLARIRERGVPPYVTYSPDGKSVASAGRIWDASSGETLVTLRHQDPQNDDFWSFCPIFYTPDGKQLITAEPDGTRIWDLAAGREVRRAIRWSNHHYRAQLSPDGRFLATRGPGGRSRGESREPPITLWELASGQEVVSLDVHDETILLRSFSPNGRCLALASGVSWSAHDPTVWVWDLATGRELRRFQGHRGAINALAFSPDGRSVVSGSEDATAVVWDVSDLRDHRDAEPLAAETLKARWEELADTDAGAAYRAGWALSIPSAVPFLRDHLLPTEAAAPMTAPEVLRSLRAITALERAGTPEARGVIAHLANGDPNARATCEARSTLDRLIRRPEN